ncbi:MAG TPA: DUF2339 domain-containing protein, partial [Oleiagrimonas sp.]|nr:DUF2339 domain-containing protein [Oleiagrimonas sp.]
MLVQQSLFAFVTGGLLGLLWARVSALAAGLRHVQERLAEPVSVAEVRNDLGAADSASPPGFDTQTDSGPVGTIADIDPAPLHPMYELPDAAMSVPPAPEPIADAEDAIAPPPPPADFDLLPRLWRKAWGWLTTGNVPVKVGMIVLFAGVAALLKYTADAWLTAIPMGVRIAAVALVALAALGFGWAQRDRRRVFALSIQGGAIGVLIIAVFMAFRLYDLLPAGVAFALLVALVGATGVLALRQDALALAVLALLAGFAAPILASDGHGSHVTLFAYYTVLNLAVLAMAWRRSWRVINLLGFIATFAVATAWGVLRYRPEWFASTEPFLLVNFALYLAIPWLYLRRA